MIIFSTQAFVLIGLLVLGWLLDMSGCYFLALGVAVVMVIYQYFLAKTKLYYQAFYNNHWLGLVVFLGIVGNYL
jgi:4-hydroxybenzoate polyprenyltransferase